MRGFFGRFKEITTKNYPGEVCLRIELAGCNLKCGYCNASAILARKKEYERDIDLVKKSIRKNKGIIDGVVLTGGEPTLQPKIVEELAKFAKRNGLKVCVETNGTRIEVLQELIKKDLLDFISLDIKAPLNEEDYKKVCGKNSDTVVEVKKTIKLLQKKNVDYELRTPLIPGITTDGWVKKLLKGLPAKNRWVWVPFKKGELVNPEINNRKFSRIEDLSLELIRKREGIKLRKI